LGGANLIESGLRACFFQANVPSPPNFYSYNCDDEKLIFDEEFEETSADIYRWTIELKKMRGAHVERFCLSNQEKKGIIYLPPPSDELIAVLSKSENPTETDAWLPDVVIFDDLGTQMGSHLFAAADIEAKDFEVAISNAIKDRDNLFKQISEKQDTVFQLTQPGYGSQLKGAERDLESAIEKTKSQAKEIQGITLQRLYTILRKRVHQGSNTGNYYPAEPVIILNSSGRIPELATQGEFTESDLPFLCSLKPKNNIWNHTYNCEELRRRTIVIFDAETIRNEIPVSSGLSWERTAQDTVTEFKRCRKLRGFLDFGIVVIRFGVTGIITIINEGNGKWSHTLYFNPEQDDSAWANRNEGEVLGSTSVLISTICEELFKACKYRCGNPIFPDIKAALDRALLISLTRLLSHYEWGYGTEVKDLPDELLYFTRSFPSPLQIMKWNIPSLENTGYRSQFAGTLIQKIQFSPYKSRHWSILSQSCQADINDLAQDIVLWGPKYSLNTMEDSAETFAELWLDESLQIRNAENAELQLNESPDDRQHLVECLVVKLGEISATSHKTLRNVIGLRPFSALTKLEERLTKEIELWKTTIETLHQKLQKEILDEDTKKKGVAKEWDAFIDDKENIDAITSDFNPRWKQRLVGHLAEMCRRSADSQVWYNSASSPFLWLGETPKEGKSDKRLLVIDRKEVEGIRAVKRMIQQYISDVKNHKAHRPLSIAVFGPPGSGKSVAVNKIIEMGTDSDLKAQIRVLNLSTYSSFEAFDRHFQDIVKELATQKHELPVIFFDEFDASLVGKPYGWLKFFLSIMEDGKPIKEAIFIFAGGTADTFEAFNKTEQTRSDERWAEFSLQKGPDFISRLKGHINVVGINPAGPEDDLYLIRRALTLRFLISESQDLKEGDKAKIDKSMLNAFLHVPRYIHGSRSMRMLVDLCVKGDEKIIAMSEVPPIHQLDMQVDGKAFSALASGQISPNLYER